MTLKGSAHGMSADDESSEEDYTDYDEEGYVNTEFTIEEKTRKDVDDDGTQPGHETIVPSPLNRIYTVVSEAIKDICDSSLKPELKRNLPDSSAQKERNAVRSKGNQKN